MKQFFNIEIEAKTNRIFGLDILRAVAILQVVFIHGLFLLPEELAIYHYLFAIDGVTIFFVLSGFLIGGILIKQLEENRPSKKLLVNFWIRRWFRTLPNYYLVLFVLLLVDYRLGVNSTWSTVKPYLIFSQNLFNAHPNFFPEAWSLSIEEWFYIITPLSIYAVIRVLRLPVKQSVLFVSIIVVLVSILFRYWRFLTLDVQTVVSWDSTLRKQVFTRLDSLMVGILSAYFYYYHKDKWFAYKRNLFSLGILLFLITKCIMNKGLVQYSDLYQCVFSFVVISVATAFLLPYLSSVKKGRGFIYKALTTISLISYSMYLVHLSLVRRFLQLVPWPNSIEDNTFFIATRYLIFWIGTIMLSMLIYKYFELPMMKLRDHEKVKLFVQRLFKK